MKQEESIEAQTDEIERRFLVSRPAWEKFLKQAKDVSVLNIFQGYLALNPVSRLRIIARTGYADCAEHTIKLKRTGITTPEYNTGYPVEYARDILNELPHRITKVRYVFRYAGKLWAVDDFQDANAGLLVAEIELRHEDEKFRLPKFICAEITDIRQLSNAALAFHPLCDWSVWSVWNLDWQFDVNNPEVSTEELKRHAKYLAENEEARRQ